VERLARDRRQAARNCVGSMRPPSAQIVAGVTRRAVAILAVVMCGCCPACSRSASPPVSAEPHVREQDVRFPSGPSTLAGTLFLPGIEKRHAAVVLFHGSGPEHRNTLMGRWFAEQGVAALAYDKRGVGDSTGDFRTVPFMDLCDDGLAAIAFLEARRDIDPDRIGVWGLSQGGWLGPLAASRSPEVKFVIAVSGPGVSPGEQMIFYYGNQLRRAGLSANDIEEASALRRQVWEYGATRSGYDAAKAAIDRAMAKAWFTALKAQPDDLFKGLSASAILNDQTLRAGPWYKGEMSYDPRIALRKLSVPALFIFGEDDDLVPVRQSVAIIQDTLDRSGRRDFAIKIFPAADHVMHVRASDGNTVFADGYLDTMSHWLRTRAVK
jgi:pimeloyl-ACP methyl ester carboxylesterase